jgi:NAD(P)H-hydrate epimerase
MKVTTVDEMRELDRRAISEYSIPEPILMENAGHAAFCVAHREIGVGDKSFVVLCGPGNNGGDGLVVARKLHSSGARVESFVLGDPREYRGSAKTNLEMLERSGSLVDTRPSLEAIHRAIVDSDVVVDALLGTGLTREVGGVYAKIIEEVNRHGRQVLSLDIPSGVDGSTGQVKGVAVRADYTVTFGLPKRGLLLYPGAERIGRLFVTHISFPPALCETDTIKVALSEPSPLPRRRVDGHKGTFGDALFVAGAASYFGAPTLSALSMLKAGGGYSRLATPRSVVPVAATLGSEIVFTPLEETPAGSLALSNAERLLELSERVDLVVVGPGLSLHEETRELARVLVERIEKPLLLDGDGLTAIAASTGGIRGRPYPTVLTPHAGEMARIAGVPTDQVKDDPIGVLQRTARALGSVVVLKGAHSLIGLPDERVFVNTSGNSGMASAGSGDVLTGTIAAMYGLGLSVEDAVRTGVFIHGFAGDLAAREKGEDGMIARDVLEHLPGATKRYREEYREVTRSFHGAVEVI